MRRYIPTLVLIVLAIGTASDARAQFQIGIRGGYDIETEDPLIGVEARFGLNNPNLPIYFAPSFDYYFIDNDNFSFYEIDVNALYAFGINNQVFTPYAGAGLGIGISSVEIGDNRESDSDIGVNLVGGAVFGFSRVRPFIQARLKVGGDADLATLHGGVLFSL